jgi:hypothetical protein
VILAAVIAVTTALTLRLRFTGVPLDDWDEIGYYAIRDMEHLSRMERRLLPYLTGVPNLVPLYQHRADPTVCAYRVRSGPWINPTPEDVTRYACDAEGEPLFAQHL